MELPYIHDSYVINTQNNYLFLIIHQGYDSKFNFEFYEYPPNFLN